MSRRGAIAMGLTGLIAGLFLGVAQAPAQAQDVDPLAEPPSDPARLPFVVPHLEPLLDAPLIDAPIVGGLQRPGDEAGTSERGPDWLPGPADPPVLEAEAPEPEPPAPVLTPQERFDALFAELAAADTPTAAAFIAEEIEALWRASGDASADLLIDRALEAEMDGESDLARDLIDGALELAPDASRAWSESAMLAFGNDDLARALSDISRAAELEPRQYDTLVGLGLILEQLGQPEGAFRAYEQALEVYPLHPDAVVLIERVREDAVGSDL